MSTTPPTPSGFDPSAYLEPVTPSYESAPIEPADDASLLSKSFFLGFVGAIAGAICYAAFILSTGIQIGYLAVGVAWLVAKAMMIGSKERGGRPYQITAIILTIISVAMGNSIMLWWDISHRQGSHLLIPNLHGLALFLRFGFEAPFLEFQDSPFGAAIGLFILFIGLRAAWRMTSGEPGASHHPFSR